MHTGSTTVDLVPVPDLRIPVEYRYHAVLSAGLDLASTSTGKLAVLALHTAKPYVPLKPHIPSHRRMEGADAVAGRDTTAPDYRAMVAVLEAKIARAERLIGRWYLRTIQEADLQESVEVQTATTDVESTFVIESQS